MSAQKIEAELRAFTDSFVNLVRAGRIGDDSAASKKSKAPGELVEVLAEKVLLGAQNLLQITAELKRRAFLANSGSQLAKTEGLGTLAEAQERIASLEDELSKAEEELKKRGKQPAEFREHGTHSADFQQLCALAQELRGH